MDKSKYLMELSPYYPKIRIEERKVRQYPISQEDTQFICSTLVRMAKDNKWYTRLHVNSGILNNNCSKVDILLKLIEEVHLTINLGVVVEQSYIVGLPLDRLDPCQLSEKERLTFNKSK